MVAGALLMPQLVRSYEVPKMRFFLILIGLIWSGLAMAMAATEALLLTRLGARVLPIALLLTCGFSVGGAAMHGALLGRMEAPLLFLGTLAGSALAVLAGAFGINSGYPWVCLALFSFYGTCFSLVSAQLFGLAGECIDSFSSKRLFPLLAMGCTAGELLGGLAVVLGGNAVHPTRWLYLWSLCFVLAGTWLLLHRGPLQSWRHTPQPARRSERSGAVAAFIARSPMSRALALLLAGMILCQGVSQYLFSQVFQKSFPRAEDLAAFLGALLAITNCAELVIAWWITPRLVAGLGVARAALIHPLAMLLSLVALNLSWTLGPALLLWISRRTLQDCLGLPVRNLLYNAIPQRLRAWLRAFLDGVVISVSQGVAGLTLLVLQQSWTAPQIARVGLGLGVLYCGGSLLAGRNYLRTLVGELEGEGLKLRAGVTGGESTGTDFQRFPQCSVPEVYALLGSSPPALLRAAVTELAWRSDPLAREFLARCLADARRAVREHAARMLGAAGDVGVRSVEPYLWSDRVSTVEAAVEALGHSGSRWSRQILQSQLSGRVQRAADAWVAAAGMGAASSLEERFLREALHNLSAQNQRLALYILRWLEGEELLDTLRLSLAGGKGRQSNALEVLSNLGERHVAQLLVMMLESNTPADRLRALQAARQGSVASGDIMAWALHAPDPWVRRAGLCVTHGAAAGERACMEQLLALRLCPPFGQLSLDDLEALRVQLLEERYPAGAQLWEKGQALDRGYVLLEGVMVGENTRFFGGVELLDGLTARSPLQTAGAVRVLAIRRGVLERAIGPVPGLASGLFRWLASELRRTEHETA